MDETPPSISVKHSGVIIRVGEKRVLEKLQWSSTLDGVMDVREEVLVRRLVVSLGSSRSCLGIAFRAAEEGLEGEPGLRHPGNVFQPLQCSLSDCELDGLTLTYPPNVVQGDLVQACEAQDFPEAIGMGNFQGFNV